MKPIRTAIIGTGFMGRAHLEAVRRTELVEAVAITHRCGQHRSLSNGAMLARHTSRRTCKADESCAKGEN